VPAGSLWRSGDAGIDLIGRGQTAAGPGEIADLAGIDDGDRNIGGHQRPDGRHLVTAGGFDDDKLCAGYRRRERGPACCIVVEADNGAFAFDSNVEMGLRNIDTDHESFGGMHGVLLLATRAQGPTNRSREDMATEMLAEARVQNPRMTRIPAAQPHYTATATYKDDETVLVSTTLKFITVRLRKVHFRSSLGHAPARIRTFHPTLTTMALNRSSSDWFETRS